MSSITGTSIDQYETSTDVSRFLVEVRRVLALGMYVECRREGRLHLFRGKANCNSCHLDGQVHCPTPAQARRRTSEDTGAPADTRPVFTCFGSANLGLPSESEGCHLLSEHAGFLRLYRESFGFGFRDLGLGTFLRSGPGSWASRMRLDTICASSDGKMQTSSARMPPWYTTGPTRRLPGPYFQKKFFHNGYSRA